jgi:hypothetical protein
METKTTREQIEGRDVKVTERTNTGWLEIIGGSLFGEPDNVVVDQATGRTIGNGPTRQTAIDNARENIKKS